MLCVQLGEKMTEQEAAEAASREAARAPRTTRITASRASSRSRSRQAPLPGAPRGSMTLVADILRQRRSGRAANEEAARWVLGFGKNPKPPNNNKGSAWYSDGRLLCSGVYIN